MGLFKKKKQVVIPEKPKRMDLSKYKMKMSIKAICMFERLSGCSFFRMSGEEAPYLMYSVFYTSNDIDMRFETFIGILENPQIAQWVVAKFADILEVVEQFRKEGDEPGEKKEDEEDVITMTDLATTLIADYHLDPHYVMSEMELWEIEPFFKACDAVVKKRYEEERLWAYIGVLPHIDGKKVKGPDQLLPFPWEKDMKKKKVEKDLENNMYAIKHTIGMSIDDILNGKG